jgi:hypothetical protein
MSVIMVAQQGSITGQYSEAAHALLEGVQKSLPEDHALNLKLEQFARKPAVYRGWNESVGPAHTLTVLMRQPPAMPPEPAARRYMDAVDKFFKKNPTHPFRRMHHKFVWLPTPPPV